MTSPQKLKTNGILILLAILLLGVSQISPANAYTKEINYKVPSGNSNARFVVQTLKYEPYPVAAGDWFDLWVKVQNIGSDDASNTKFQLVPEYPFSSSDSLVRKYGIVPGTFTAFKDKQLGDTEVQANQVVMKFRVKVADNAPTGTSIIKLRTSVDNSQNGLSYDLPIEVAKSKVSFDVTMQNQKDNSLFTITNTGEEPASNIILKINKSEWGIIRGDLSTNLGKINNGQFTQFSIAGIPKEKNVHFYLSYTDIGGTRRTALLNIPTIKHNKTSSQNSTSFYLASIFGIIGILVGILIMFFSRKIHKKKGKK